MWTADWRSVNLFREALLLASEIPALVIWRARRLARRRQAQIEALELALTTKLRAETDLRNELATAVQRSWPSDTQQLEELFWPPFAKYCEAVFTKIADSRLKVLGPKLRVRHFLHWLSCTCIPGVVEDACNGIRFADTAKYLIDVIGDPRWPAPAEETRRALAKLMTEVLGGPHSDSLEKRLKAFLEGQLSSWEAKAIEAKATLEPSVHLIRKLDVIRINKWINDEGYTNEELADILKVSVRTVSSLRNDSHYHGEEAVTKLANLMKLDPGDLYLP